MTRESTRKSAGSSYASGRNRVAAVGVTALRESERQVNLLVRWRHIVRAGFVCSTLLLAFAGVAQSVDFKIVWINIGEVATSHAGQPARAGRQLFMAPDLVELSLKKITVARVDVDPTIVPLKLGDHYCLTSVRALANADDRTEVDSAPLTVSVRQDQRERLGMRRTKDDICFTPTSPGEYPVRFNSLLPARDGTIRGAQIFLRVQGEDVDAQPAPKNAEPVREDSNQTSPAD